MGQFAYLGKKLKGFGTGTPKRLRYNSRICKVVRARGDGEEFGVYVEKINDRAYLTHTAGVYPGKSPSLNPEKLFVLDGLQKRVGRLASRWSGIRETSNSTREASSSSPRGRRWRVS
jgi:hypothetical protein